MAIVASRTSSAVGNTASITSAHDANTFDGKRALLEAVIDATITGPDTTTPLEEQSAWDEIALRPMSRARLRDYVGPHLRAGLSSRRAAERYCALSSPEMHHLLTVKLGWSPRMHEDWLAQVSEHDLLGAE